MNKHKPTTPYGATQSGIVAQRAPFLTRRIAWLNTAAVVVILGATAVNLTFDAVSDLVGWVVIALILLLMVGVNLVTRRMERDYEVLKDSPELDTLVTWTDIQEPFNDWRHPRIMVLGGVYVAMSVLLPQIPTDLNLLFQLPTPAVAGIMAIPFLIFVLIGTLKYKRLIAAEQARRASA